jgi:tetratricopeptide (TPR) repeat protein
VVAVLALAGGLFYTRPAWYPITASEYYNRGETRLQSGSYDLAIADFTQAIALQSDFADAFHGRGQTYMLKGSYDQAANDFSDEIKIDGLQRPAAYVSRADAYMQLKRYTEAMSDYAHVIDVCGCTDMYGKRAAALLALGDFQNAVNDYNKAIESQADDSALYLGRGTAECNLGDKAAAIADFKKVLEISTSDSEKAEAQKQLSALGAA